MLLLKQDYFFIENPGTLPGAGVGPDVGLGPGPGCGPGLGLSERGKMWGLRYPKS